jgi:hypothetical protein
MTTLNALATFDDCANQIIRPTYERIQEWIKARYPNTEIVITHDRDRCRLDVTEKEGEEETRYFRIHMSYQDDWERVNLIPLSILKYKIVIDQNRSRYFSLSEISTDLVESVAVTLMRSIGMTI